MVPAAHSMIPTAPRSQAIFSHVFSRVPCVKHPDSLSIFGSLLTVVAFGPFGMLAAIVMLTHVTDPPLLCGMEYFPCSTPLLRRVVARCDRFGAGAVQVRLSWSFARRRRKTSHTEEHVNEPSSWQADSISTPKCACCMEADCWMDHS